MRYARMREILEGPLLLTDESREPRWSGRDRRRRVAIAPYPEAMEWELDDTDDVRIDTACLPIRSRGSEPLPSGGG